MMRAAIVLVLISGPAFAQPPRYDVEAHCDQVAGFGGAYRNDMASFCIGSEQSAYNALKSEWDARAKRHSSALRPDRDVRKCGIV